VAIPENHQELLATVVDAGGLISVAAQATVKPRIRWPQQGGCQDNSFEGYRQTLLSNIRRRKPLSGKELRHFTVFLAEA
jgi:hypothetical protein